MTLKHYVARWLQRSALLRWMLSLAVKLFIPRNHIGAVGVIFNAAGQVLLVEHVFRPYQAWGLPGGWVDRGENPAQTIEREVKEELNLRIEVKKLLFCESQGGHDQTTAPLSIGLAYYCRLTDESALPDIEQARNGFEVLSTRWVYPEQIEWLLLPLQQRAIILGQQEFDREQFVT